MKKTIQLIVAGAGEVTEKALWNPLKNNALGLGMRIHTLIDVLPKPELSPTATEIIKSGANYLLANEALHKLVLPDNPVAMIMTPNSSHLHYTKLFSSLGLKTSIEKPLVANLDDLREIKAIYKKYPDLLYGMQAVADGMCVGIQLASGMMPQGDPRRRFLKVSPERTEDSKVAALFNSLGKLERVQGWLLEGSGSARGTLLHRQWLMDGRQGGMIRDLVGHLLSPLLDAGFITGETQMEKIELGFHEQDSPLGTYRPLKSPAEAETYAKMSGKFIATASSPGTISFEFSVGKYWTEDKLMLRLFFERGFAELYYLPPTTFSFEIEGGERIVIENTSADHHELALLDFRNFLDGGENNHIERGVRIVEFNEKMREIGLRNFGL